MRFLHSSDWQLGMTRHYFDEGAQERFTQARFDAITRLAAEAKQHGCGFVVVAGDVFETNQVDRRTVLRSMDALKAFEVPVYLLPGNHDCYDPGSIYRSQVFLENRPAHVEVLTDSEPRIPADGVEVVGATWTSKRPLTDLAVEAAAGPPAADRQRVVVAHGAVDEVIGEVSPDPSLIRIADVESAIADGHLHYLALGDRHSCTNVGSSGRVWYSGAPEPTSYRETDPGVALVVDLGPESVEVERIEVGTWSFHTIEEEVSGDEDIAHLAQLLDSIEDRARAVVKVKVTGSLTLKQAAALEDLLDERGDVFGALEHPERHKDLAVVPEDGDFSDLELHGYAAVARDRLQGRANAGGDDAGVATEALALLLRLAGDAA